MSLDHIKELSEIVKSLLGEGWLRSALMAVWAFLKKPKKSCQTNTYCASTGSKRLGNRPIRVIA